MAGDILARFFANGEATFASLLSLAIFTGAILATRRAFRLDRGIETTGEIIDYRDRSSSEGTAFAAVFRFHADGREIVVESTAGRNRPGPTGVPVRVRYDPQEPERAVIGYSAHHWTAAIVAWVAAIFVLWTAWRAGR